MGRYNEYKYEKSTKLINIEEKSFKSEWEIEKITQKSYQINYSLNCLSIGYSWEQLNPDNLGFGLVSWGDAPVHYMWCQEDLDIMCDIIPFYLFECSHNSCYVEGSTLLAPLFNWIEPFE